MTRVVVTSVSGANGDGYGALAGAGHQAAVRSPAGRRRRFAFSRAGGR
jgi:hypothetical protein